MKSRALAAVAITSIALVLAGCADVVVDPERAAENKSVLSEVQNEAKNLGLTVGDIRKSCAMPFGCSANDLYEASAYIADPTLTDEIMCSQFVDLADRVGYTSSWRDQHPEESGPGSKVEDLWAGCIESIGVNDGVGINSQSEGVVFVGTKVAENFSVNYWVQLQSVVQPDGAPEGERGYYFSISTFY